MKRRGVFRGGDGGDTPLPSDIPCPHTRSGKCAPVNNLYILAFLYTLKSEFSNFMIFSTLTFKFNQLCDFSNTLNKNHSLFLKEFVELASKYL